MKSANGSESVQTPGPWSQLAAIRSCPCSDGKRRTARITGQPDTMFSCPASVKAKGKTVTGFVTTAPDYKEGVKEGWIFQPNKFGKNASVLPEWSDETLRAF
jgi:hypothetical protein